jgi:hypothetical protein
MSKILREAEFIILFAPSSYMLPDDSAGGIARERWWTNQEFSYDNIIPPWFSQVICHLVDEK